MPVPPVYVAWERAHSTIARWTWAGGDGSLGPMMPDDEPADQVTASPRWQEAGDAAEMRDAVEHGLDGCTGRFSD